MGTKKEIIKNIEETLSRPNLDPSLKKSLKNKLSALKEERTIIKTG